MVSRKSERKYALLPLNTSEDNEYSSQWERKSTDYVTKVLLLVVQKLLISSRLNKPRARGMEMPDEKTK